MSIAPINQNPIDVKQAVREQAGAINELMKGRSNAYGEVTLTASAETTVVYDPNVGADSFIDLSPKTANASRCGWYIADADRVPGTSFTVTHDSDALTDKTFDYMIQG